MLDEPVSKYTDHHMTVVESNHNVEYAAKVMTDSHVESISSMVHNYFLNQKTFIDNIQARSLPEIRTTVERNNYNLNILTEIIKNRSLKLINNQSNYLKKELNKLKLKVENKSNNTKLNIQSIIRLFKKQTGYKVDREMLMILNQENMIKLLNPESILKRGYSITYINNKRLTNYNQVKKDDEITTKLFKGFVHSKVKNKSLKKGY